MGGVMLLDVADPCWLVATGDPQRVEVLRSPMVDTADEDYAPVARFIAEHGLVLAAQETFTDDRWMHGSVEFSVFVPPAARNVNYGGIVSRWLN